MAEDILGGTMAAAYAAFACYSALFVLVGAVIAWTRGANGEHNDGSEYGDGEYDSSEHDGGEYDSSEHGDG